MVHETLLTIAADHPAFAGHFPGTPIVPGVVLLDEVLFAIESTGEVRPAECTIASAKFFRPVRPGARLTLRHEAQANGSIRFDISEGAHKVASGSIVPRATAAKDGG